MVLLPSVEPYTANAFKTFARLAPPSSQMDVVHVTNGQFIANYHNTDKCDASSNSIIPLDNQSAAILQKFSIGTEELKDFTKQVSSDLTKMTQAHKTVQEHTGKLIENMISQALTKVQDTGIPSYTTVDASFQGENYTNPSYESNWTSTWSTSNPLCHTTQKLTHI